MSLIEKYSHNEEGYNPFLIREGWQVAQLNYAEEQNIENITKIDVHYKTDEVFILLSGEAVLISATLQNDIPLFNTEFMQHGIVYNIPKNLWHNIAMREGSQVIIVEKSDTHLGDFEYFNLNEMQISIMKEKVEKSFDLFQ